MKVYKRRTDYDRKDRSFDFSFDNRYQLFLFFIVLLLAVVVALSAAAVGSNVINNEKNAVFEHKWQYSIDGGEFLEVTLPSSKEVSAKSHLTLKNRLPLEMVRGATVLIRTSQQEVKVAVDGEVIYNTRDSKNHIASPSSAYHFVRMPSDGAGKSITVVLSSPYENYAGFMSQIYIGSKASNLFFLLHENGLRFIIGFLVSSVGLLMMILFSFAKGQENKGSLPSLGAFFFCAGYWVLAESKMMQFIFPYPMALTNSSIFALTLLPLFSGFYYYSMHTKTFPKLGKCAVIAAAAASFAFAVAAAIDPLLPIRIFPFYLVFLVLYLLLLFATILIESIKKGRFFTTSVCGIIAFNICAMVELIFYLSNMKTYNKSNFLTLGLLLLCIFMVVDSVQNFSRVYRAAIQVDALSILAYTDSLTGLQNRTAFLEEIGSINVDREAAVTIGMYDVNNLKPVNDAKGHLVGDALLWHCARAIKASLRQEDKVYRIGGDEFVAIIRHEADFDSDGLEGRLLTVLQSENKKTLSYTMSIAYGFATYTKGIDKTLFDTQARADESMYACKKVQKAPK